MDIDDVARLFEQSSRSAFRMETRPDYAVPQEVAALERWEAGDRTLDTLATSPWLARIADETSRGYQWSRVRILDYPLSAYSQFELHGYQANQAAGEQIHVVDRRWSPELDALREDFWMLDDEVVIRMIYDESNGFLRPELADDPQPYREAQATARKHAVPLDDYLEEVEPDLIAGS